MVKIKDGCVICDYCGKTLFVVEDKDKGKNGVIAFKATQKGFTVKHPLFFGIAEFKIFCDKKCNNEWFRENISEEELKKGREVVQKLREDLTNPQSIQSLQKGIAKIQNLAKDPKQLQILLQKERGSYE